MVAFTQVAPLWHPFPRRRMWMELSLTNSLALGLAATPKWIIPVCVSFWYTHRGRYSHGRGAATYLLKLFMYPPHGRRGAPTLNYRVHTTLLCGPFSLEDSKTASLIMEPAFCPLVRSSAASVSELLNKEFPRELRKQIRKWLVTGFLLRLTFLSAILSAGRSYMHKLLCFFYWRSDLAWQGRVRTEGLWFLLEFYAAAKTN